MKEQIVRRVKPQGNGAHVFTPKDWLGEEVLVVRTARSLKERILQLLEPHLQDVVGAFLFGSRARGDATSDSDVDLLLVTTKPLKLSQSGFDIIQIQLNSLEKSARLNAPIIHTALQEAKPIINAPLLEQMKKRIKNSPAEFEEFVQSTKRIQRIVEGLLEGEQYAPAEIVYSLILRLRGIHAIRQLLKERSSTNTFRQWIEKQLPHADFDSVYQAYMAVRLGKNRKRLPLDIILPFYKLLEDQINALAQHFHGKKRVFLFQCDEKRGPVARAPRSHAGLQAMALRKKWPVFRPHFFTLLAHRTRPGFSGESCRCFDSRSHAA